MFSYKSLHTIYNLDVFLFRIQSAATVCNSPGGSVLRSFHTPVQSPQNLKPMLLKELSCDVVEYRHVATLPSHHSVHDQSDGHGDHHPYTSSSKHSRSPHVSLHPQSTRQHAVMVSKKSIISQIQVNQTCVSLSYCYTFLYCNCTI